MGDSIYKVDEMALALKAFLPMKPEYQQKLDKKFRLEFNYNSNHLEGNTLTYGETELLLIFGDTQGNHNLREYEEMKGHDVAIKLIEDLVADKEHPLTESFIKNLNTVILKEPFWKEAITANGQNTRRLIKIGNYKEHSNSARLPNGEMFNYASPGETPILMQELVDWYRTEETVLHPVILAVMLHYKFVRIHPFDDGNGRIARLLMNYVLLKNNLPSVIIKSADKQNYLRALHLADVGNYESFIDYVAAQVVWSLEVSIKAAKGENIEEQDDWEKELQLLKKKIGQKDNSKIESKYSRENVEAIYENSIKPLAEKWEVQLENIDGLFYYRKCAITITPDFSNLNYETTGNTLDELKKLWNLVFPQIKTSIRTIGISCSYEKIRMSAKETKFNAGTIEFSFHDNAYEISFQDTIPTRSILYKQFLSEEEIITIISTFSRNLINSIRETTD